MKKNRVNLLLLSISSSIFAKALKVKRMFFLRNYLFIISALLLQMPAISEGSQCATLFSSVPEISFYEVHKIVSTQFDTTKHFTIDPAVTSDVRAFDINIWGRPKEGRQVFARIARVNADFLGTFRFQGLNVDKLEIQLAVWENGTTSMELNNAIFNKLEKKVESSSLKVQLGRKIIKIGTEPNLEVIFLDASRMTGSEVELLMRMIAEIFVPET